MVEGAALDDLIRRQRPGFTLEQAFYRDPGVFRRDLERVISRSWLYVDHASEIPGKGDYLVYDIGDESIVVIRGDDGGLRAFFNVCRHRGSRICLDARGNRRRLTCPYHAWSWDLEGRLVAARGMGEGFERRDYPLHRCGLRVWHGLIFVCLAPEDDPGHASFESMARDMEPVILDHRLEDTRVAARRTYPTAANWKLAIENYRECYHCVPAHPEFAGVNAYVKADDREPDGYRAAIDAWAGKTRALGLPVGSFEPDRTDPRQPHAWWRQPIREGYLTLSGDGRPVAPLMGDLRHWDGGETALVLGPLSYAYLCSDHLTMFRFTPVSPLHSEVVVTWHVRADAGEGDWDPERLVWLWDVTTRQDTEITVNNQRGVNSGRYRPGPYAPQEYYTAEFTSWYLERIVGAGAA